MFREPSAQDQAIAIPSRAKVPARSLAIAAAIILIAAALILYFFTSSLAAVSIDSRRLTIASVEMGTFQRDIASDAVVIAPGYRTLTAVWSGTVALDVSSGDAIKEGELLAMVDSPDLQNKILEARAKTEALEVDAKRSVVEAAKAKLVAEEEIENEVVGIAVATRELDRKRRAFTAGAYPEVEVSRAADELEKAQRRARTAKAAAELDETRRSLEIKGRQLAHKQQQLLTEDLERQARLLHIVSPVTGQVAQVFVGNNAPVSRDDSIVTVVDLSRLELEMKIPQSLATNIPNGARAEVSIGTEKHQARVVGIAPEVLRGEVTARLQFEGAVPTGLRQGQRLSAEIVLDRREGVVMVRRGSFLEELGGRQIYVVTGDRATRRRISVGMTNMESVEIREGLQPGERVIVSGSAELGDVGEALIK